MVVHFVAFYLIFLNIPDDAPVVFDTTTQKRPYLTPRYSSNNSTIRNSERGEGQSRFCFALIRTIYYIFSLSVSIALLCSFLLGLGDSCFNTQLYSILGCVYAEQSTPAFAIFKFIQVIPSCQFSDVVSRAEQSWVKMLSSQVWNKFTWSPIKKRKEQDPHTALNLPFFFATKLVSKKK